MTKVTKTTPIIGPIGAFFVSTKNNEVIHQPLLGGLNILQGLTLKCCSNQKLCSYNFQDYCRNEECTYWIINHIILTLGHRSCLFRNKFSKPCCLSPHLYFN